MAESHDPADAAALSTCESMLLRLVGARMLTELEVLGPLDDAAAAHLALGGSDAKTARGAAVAGMIATIAAGDSAARRRSGSPSTAGH